jgi:AraC-like DNA-binding protein
MEGEILTFTPEFAGSLSKIPEAPAAIDAILQAAPRLALSNSSATCVRKWFHEFSADLAPSNQPFSVPRIACAFGLLACRLAALPEFVALAADSGRVHPELVRNFLQLLETGYLDRRDPAWYAVTLNVSPRTLDRHLVKALKNNCRELIAKRLVLEAKRLMADPDSQLQSVAHALRFEDVAGFSRFFHNNAGLSPRDFKTQIPNWLV